LFTPLHRVIAELGESDFPTLQDCNALLAKYPPSISVLSGMPLRFVPQQSGVLPFEAQYEPRCYLAGEVQMRTNNWHDLLNAMVWLTFPKTKAALNSRHYHALIDEMESDKTRRGSVRDVNTLLDESGVIVVYADAELADLLRCFKWKELFLQRREQVRAGMGFFILGHGLYEKARQPYVGMTGHGLLIKVAHQYFSWPLAQQLKHLDYLLANHLATPGRCCSTRELSPVPLLGVPGWSTDNENAAYYDNISYFRPGRRA